MWQDSALQLSKGQVVTVTAPSQNVIDQGTAGDAYGRSLWLVVQMRAAALPTTASVEFQIQTATDAAFTTPVVIGSSGAKSAAGLLANTEPVKMKIPPGALQFVRLNYVVTAGPLTQGTVDAFLTPDVKVGNQ